MMLPLGKVMNECEEENEPTFFIQSNTTPEWKLVMYKHESIQVRVYHQIEAPGITLTISNTAFFTELAMNPSDAVKLGEELVALGKSALPHNYKSWQEKNLIKNVRENYPELIKRKEKELLEEFYKIEKEQTKLENSLKKHRLGVDLKSSKEKQ